MARIIIARPSGANQLEVEQSAFDAGYFPGFVYVRDASSSPSTEPNVLDAAMAGLVPSASGSATAAALRAAYVPKWKPSTAYASGEYVLNPSGQIVSANTAFTSGASYSASNWTVVSGGGSYTDEQAQDAVAAMFAAGTDTGIAFVYDDAGNRIGATVSDTTKAPLLAPTATKTAAYTAAVGELAMMNVAGGATVLTLPTAPANKAQVGYRAIGATPTVPLTITAGGSDTIGTAGGTAATVPLADEVTVLQYDSANTRWLGVSNVKPLGSTQGRAVPGRRIAALGDSLTAGMIGAATPNANNVLQGSYLMYACMASLGRLEWGGQFGVPGDTTAMILARVGQVIAAAPDACIVLGGTNDGAIATIKTNIPLIVAALKAVGIEPILCTLPPSSSSNALTAGPHLLIRQVNGWITKYATLNGLRLLDLFGQLVDPATGKYLTGYNTDITHPNRKGYRVLGQYISSALSSQVKAGSSWLTQDIGEGTVISGGDAGLFTTGTTLPANTPAGSAWTQAAGAAGAFVTDSFFSGRAYQIARASTDATSRVITLFQGAGVGTFAVGDLLSVSAKVKTTGFEASSGTATISVGCTGSTGATNIVSWQIASDFTAGASIYYEAVVPPGTTSLSISIRVDGGNGAGDTLTVGQFAVRNLTALGYP